MASFGILLRRKTSAFFFGYPGKAALKNNQRWL
jgi:hypothetical protein